MSDRSARFWWIAAILLAALPYTLIGSGVPHFGICSLRGAEVPGMGSVGAAAIPFLAFLASAALLPPLLAGLALAARRAGPRGHRIVIRTGAGAAFAAAVAYGFSPALTFPYCPAEPLDAWAVMPLYGAIGGCVLLAGLVGGPDAWDGVPGEPAGARLRRHALPAAAVAVTALPSAVNLATDRATWIGEPSSWLYAALLDWTGAVPWAVADRLVGLGLMVVVVALAVTGGRRIRRVAVSVLAVVAVIGVLLTEPLLSPVTPSPEPSHSPEEIARVQEDFYMGFLEGGIRLMPPEGVSPGWFSLAYGVAAILVLLHARRVRGREAAR
ncbi:hypothetical protein ACFFMN_26735 [Planobispora siamensis]|uniref:Uncharacterized protein n=1 Tax=Planobispora siamensis TaxID=936338 RepID=A0A8J3SCM2_9ACTN|nr:hypothetical protein [Planobispora siamensis]GIH90735.1 hypothetical protein Psi01_13650 [Planobispora siamensis]